jgi:DNA damage-binding protein 1
MSMIHSTVVYGTISMLQRLRPKDSDRDILFVGTDRFEYFTTEWDPVAQRLRTIEAFPDVAEEHMRESQSQDKCLVDHSGQFMAMHLWEGVMNVMRLLTRGTKTKNLDLLGQVRLTELHIKGSTFVQAETGHPKLAILYQTRIDGEDAKLAIYRLTSDDRNTVASTFNPERDRELELDIPDPFAKMLIPVTIVEDETKRYHYRNTAAAKAHLGGVIVVGETLLFYIDTLTHANVSSPLKDPKIFVAWAEYDVRNYVVSDDYGTLYLLTLRTDGVVVTGLEIAPIGKTSRASSLVYMGGNMLFLGSHHGDSQLLGLDIEKKTVHLIQTVSSIAPILDFAIMDMGNREGDSQLGNEFSSGQARIVAGCGVHQNGSLRSVRSGVGLEDIGILDELENVRGLFSLRSYGSHKVDTLVISFLTDTRVFRFDMDGGIEEVSSLYGLILDQHTLLASNLSSGHLLQITPAAAILLDPESGITVNTWKAPNGASITSASANDHWALLSIDGTKLVSLNLLANLSAKQQAITQTDQIACIHAAQSPQEIGVVGFWSSGTVSIIDLETLDALQGEDLRQTEDSVSTPRDIALVQLHEPSFSGPTLFVAMEDGNVVTFNVSSKDYSLSSRKRVILGKEQARLHILPREGGTCNVFATTEHSSLIYSTQGRIVYSAVTAEDATFVAPFDSEPYPDAIVLSTEKYVKISHIDTERQSHVKSIPVGETVRRVAYSPNLKVFGLGCIKKELINNEEIVTSSFKLVDEVTSQWVGKPFPLDGSTSVEMIESVVPAVLPDSSGQPVDRFLVGTCFFSDAEIAERGDVRGRILVLGVDSDHDPYVVVSHNLKGGCRCLGVMGDKIVAALQKSVVVYSYIEDSTTTGRLKKLASWRPSSFPIDLDIAGNMIGVGDLMQSLALIEFIPEREGNKAKLEERCRHFQHSWATAISHLEGHDWLEADAQGNLMVLRRNADGPTDHDRKQMEVTADMNLGEQVNRIRKLRVAPSENAIIVPMAFLGTVSPLSSCFQPREPRLTLSSG